MADWPATVATLTTLLVLLAPVWDPVRRTVPCSTRVWPVRVLAPERTRVEVLPLRRAPAPETMPEKVWAASEL